MRTTDSQTDNRFERVDRQMRTFVPADHNRIPVLHPGSERFEPLLDSAAAVKLLQIHSETLQKLAGLGRVPAQSICGLWRFRVRFFLPDTHETEISGNWIFLAGSRLAQRRAEKPVTKAGQIRALWPEIDAALAAGRSMKSIRKWLEEDAGISLGITSLTLYISRLRRRERTNRRIEGPVQSVRVQTRVEPVPAPLSARPPISTPRQTSPATTPPNDPLAQAMRALSKRAIDIREIHTDGDPHGRKLI